MYMFPSKHETEYIYLDNRRDNEEQKKVAEMLAKGYEFQYTVGYIDVYKLEGFVKE